MPHFALLVPSSAATPTAMDGAFPSSLGEGGGTEEERRRGFRGTQENAKTKLCLRLAFSQSFQDSPGSTNDKQWHGNHADTGPLIAQRTSNGTFSQIPWWAICAIKDGLSGISGRRKKNFRSIDVWMLKIVVLPLTSNVREFRQQRGVERRAIPPSGNVHPLGQ